jgi:hypothetical protein
MSDVMKLRDAERRRCCMRLLALAVAARAPLARAEAGGLSIGGVSFGARAEVGGQQLLLNGVGLRASPTIKGFAAALYLAQSAQGGEQALRTPGAKRLRMHMMLDVPTEIFVYAIHKFVRRNVAEPQQAVLSERMGTLDAGLRAIGTVRNGDVIDLDFVPAAGLTIHINGRARTAPIPGEDLYAALLQVFIGERPVDAKMKAGLLGARPA